MVKKDYYDILGISKNASYEDIKKAYRKLAIRYHPDKNTGSKTAEEKFKEAAEAYEVLSNPERKKIYDNFGHEGLGGASQKSPGGINMEDIFGSFFGDAFSSFSFTGSKRGRSFKGSDLRIRIKLTLEEISRGVEKKIKVKRMKKAKGVRFKTCIQCNGNGHIKNTVFGNMKTQSPCKNCNGSGKMVDNMPSGANKQGMIHEEELIYVQIPTGATEGIQLKLSGKGDEAPFDGINGDLIVIIEEIPHEIFKRNGNNIHYNLYISIPEAVLGTNKEIPTLDEKVRLSIESGTQSGKIFRLKGKGIRNIDTYGNGDLLVHIYLWTPKKISRELKQIFEKIKHDECFKPKPHDKSIFEKVKEFF